MHVQEYLRTPGKSPATLNQEFGIRTATSADGRLMIFNYDQVESKPETHPIVMECRGLTLEVGTWNVVGRSFLRFFNAGQHPDITNLFDWSDAFVQEKVDGSLITVYRYMGQLYVNTRGSFGLGTVNQLFDVTWQDLFWSAGADYEALNDFISLHGDNTTVVMELCSLLNKNVRTYQLPTLYLLTIVNNATGTEWPKAVVDRLAPGMGAQRPREFGTGTSPDKLAELIQGENDPTFEGFVLRDGAGMRIKVKNEKYVALHHLKGNGESVCSPKYLIPFILDGAAEEDEVLKYLPELRPYYTALKHGIALLKAEMMNLWHKYKDVESQKEFALGVVPSKSSGFLFEARKRNVSPLVVWEARAQAFLEKWAVDNVKVPEKDELLPEYDLKLLTPAPSRFGKVPSAMSFDVTEEEALAIKAVLDAPPGSPGKINFQTERVPEVSADVLTSSPTTGSGA